MRRRTRSLAAWLALLAVLSASLVPTLARAAAAGAPAWADVCSSDGTRGLPDAAHALEHCPFCAPNGAPLLPPAAAADLVPPSLSHARPLFARDPVAPASAWRGAEARAPPRRA